MCTHERDCRHLYGCQCTSHTQGVRGVCICTYVCHVASARLLLLLGACWLVGCSVGPPGEDCRLRCDSLPALYPQAPVCAAAGAQWLGAWLPWSVSLLCRRASANPLSQQSPGSGVPHLCCSRAHPQQPRSTIPFAASSAPNLFFPLAAFQKHSNIPQLLPLGCLSDGN